MLVLGGVYWIIVMLIDSVWALVAGLAGDWFVRSPRRRERLAASGGMMMIILGGVLALERRAS